MFVINARVSVNTRPFLQAILPIKAFCSALLRGEANLQQSLVYGFRWANAAEECINYVSVSLFPQMLNTTRTRRGRGRGQDEDKTIIYLFTFIYAIHHHLAILPCFCRSSYYIFIIASIFGSSEQPITLDLTTLLTSKFFWAFLIIKNADTYARCSPVHVAYLRHYWNVSSFNLAFFRLLVLRSFRFLLLLSIDFILLQPQKFHWSERKQYWAVMVFTSNYHLTK